MSKEQTPITADEFLNEISILCDGYTYYETKKDILKVMEQYAQAKVLEALEREVIKAYEKGGNFDSFRDVGLTVSGAKEYYETEVKPKYEKERKQRSN